MKHYHYIWLRAHPHRTENWLRDKLREGFDIHHVDGEHENDDPYNLVLIECSDHMRMHGTDCNRLRKKRARRFTRGVCALDGMVLSLSRREDPTEALETYYEIMSYRTGAVSAPEPEPLFDSWEWWRGKPSKAGATQAGAKSRAHAHHSSLERA